MTIVVVMLILSVTLAVAYSVMRSQTMLVRIHANSDSRGQARQAALTALSIGLREMHQANWAGVGTMLAANLNADERYEVAFVTGDPQLTASDPDWEEWPLRVTLEATGFATAPDGSSTALHRARAVVRLVPRALAAAPAAMSEIEAHTLVQRSSGNAYLHVPVRIEGPVRLRSRLRLCENYDWSTTIRTRYLGDLEALRLAGGPDHRPLTGPIGYPYSQQNSTTRNLVETTLGIATTDESRTSLSGWSYPGPISTYRLYPGGQLYTVPTCSSTLSNTTLAADPQTNPAGIFHHGGNVTFSGNVTLRGTIVCRFDARLTGSNLDLRPVDLPPLEGTSEPVQLPLLVVGDDVKVYEVNQVQSRGLIAAWDDLEIYTGTSGVAVEHEGRVVMRELELHRRSDWDLSSLDWQTEYDDFMSLQYLLDTAPPGTWWIPYLQYFPLYVHSTRTFDPAAKIRIAPPAQPVRHHWQTNGGSIYVPHASDPGLRWDVLRWEEGS